MKEPIDSPEVSIIIPTYNRAHYLERCLDSLLEQSFINFEVLVCDDGSTDNSQEIVEKFRSRLNIQYCWNENFGGPARSRNIGIKKSKGKYIAFLDSDDWWLREKLAVSIEALEAGADLVYHDLYIYNENRPRQYRIKKLKARDLACPVFDDLLLNGNAIINSSVVVRKKILDEIVGFSEDRDLIAWEDYDAWLRISKMTDHFKRIKGCYGWYSLGNENISSAERSQRSIKKIIAIYFNKNKNELPAWMNYILARSYLRLRNYKLSRWYALRVIFQLPSVSQSFKAIIVYCWARLLVPIAGKSPENH